MKCWICDADATTGEHKIKRSDLADVFGAPTQENRLYLSDSAKKNRPIGSLKAKALKSPSRICATCNNARTQPHDRAWEQMSEYLRTCQPPIRPSSIVRANRIFPYDTKRKMQNVHLYFLKLFGCRIAEGNLPIDLATFANAILKGTVHPNVYLKFGCLPSVDGKLMAGQSDIQTVLRTADGPCAFATWFYEIGGLAVNVMFSDDEEKRLGLVDAWHPKFGTNRLVISDFPAG